MLSDVDKLIQQDIEDNAEMMLPPNERELPLELKEENPLIEDDGVYRQETF